VATSLVRGRGLVLLPLFIYVSFAVAQTTKPAAGRPSDVSAGGLFAEAAGDFLFTPAGTDLLAQVDTARAAHKAAWTNNPATQPLQNALDSEAEVHPKAAPNQQLQPNGL
jgi:hypothetical protein